jgi:hypothetical protein
LSRQSNTAERYRGFGLPVLVALERKQVHP